MFFMFFWAIIVGRKVTFDYIPHSPYFKTKKVAQKLNIFALSLQTNENLKKNIPT